MGIAVAAGIVLLSPLQRNESSRISIKRATDEAAAHIDLKPRETTVEGMLQMSRPSDLAGDLSTPNYQNKRIAPFETTVWKVKAKITEIILRPDGDFYMTIESEGGARTVVEVPDPKLCPDSKVLKQLQKLRAMLEAKFHPSAEPQKVDLKAQITGIGFFGYQGRRTPPPATTGVTTPPTPARPQTNGARLMPGLDIKFDK